MPIVQLMKSSALKISALLFLYFSSQAEAQRTEFQREPGNQTSLPFSATHIQPGWVKNTVSGSLRIFAVMVQFQPDDNDFTSGDGTFAPGSLPYLESDDITIDPLPHDTGYFEAHLEFAKNYFQKISNEQLRVEYQVFPEIITLSQKMEHYSPVGENPKLNSLAVMAQEVWEEVQAKGNLNIPGPEAENIAFVIFHAGAGRDIELTGTTLDKTPQDIPSVYLGRQALSELLEDPAFSGFPVDNGNILVDNTLILPRTLSRRGEDATGNSYTLQLSVNGMVAAQIGSHLGLPDLFNTETGESGIGRFGLMDGAGIFAYNGLFPPEPSAWEKYYSGWSDPFELEYDETAPVSLPASSLRQDESIAKVSISEDEYFLIENRHRDPDNTGVTLTIRTPDGRLATQTFTNDDYDFATLASGFEQDLIPGVVVDVDNYDFALPGGPDPGADGMKNTSDDRLLNGGLLIWHIDESVIRAKPGTEGINNNPGHRAVSLMEADGAQDIGRPVAAAFSGNEINGTAFDFWWSGNNATAVIQGDEFVLYQNRFGPDTTPSNHSNSGAGSFFELYEFSGNLPVAGFKIRRANPVPELYDLTNAVEGIEISTFTPGDDPYLKRYPLAMVPFQAENETWIAIPGNDGIRLYNPESGDIRNPGVSLPSLQQPFIGLDDNLVVLAEPPGPEQKPIQVHTGIWDGNSFQEIWNFEVTSNTGFISSADGLVLDFDGTPFAADPSNRTVDRVYEENAQSSEKAGAYRSVILDNSLILEHPGGTVTFPLAATASGNTGRAHTGVIEKQNGDVIFYLLRDDRISLFLPDDGYQQERIAAESGFIGWPAIADFDSDGNPDLLFTDHTKNQVSAVNINGALLNNFPVLPPEGVFFTGTPLIADIDDDGEKDFFITGQNRYSVDIYAYHQNGKPMDGFPLYSGGSKGLTNDPVHPVITGQNLTAVSHAGDLKTWNFKNMQHTEWAARYGNSTNNKVTGLVAGKMISEPDFTLLNDEETYNWPNPASDETNLRFQTRTPAEISVKVTTMSGRPIYNRTLESRGGPPEELRIDTSGWASGAYFALVTAKANGQDERKLVKIAIIK